MLMVKEISQKWPVQGMVSFFLVALLFSIPLSSSAKSLFGGLSIVFIVLSPVYWQSLSLVFRTNWARAALLLFVIVLLACFWSPASVSQQLNVLEKYSKLLYLPILAVGFQDEKIRRAGIYGFLLAMALTCFLSIFAYSGMLQRFAINPDYVFRNHIMTGMMMSFATWLCGFLYFRNQGLLRFLYLPLAMMFTFQIFFINTGRTAYFIYFLLLLLFVAQHSTKKRAIIGLLMVLSLSLLSYYVSPNMRSGMDKVVSDYQHYKENKNTSVGLRFQFQVYAHDLFNRHPIRGNGTASYMSLYKSENPIPSFIYTVLEPHSQYWLMAAEFGLAGLMGLFLFFGSLLWESLQLPSLRPVALASLLIFCVGNVSDSLLFYSGSGYFFILFMALCLGESRVFDRNRVLTR